MMKPIINLHRIYAQVLKGNCSIRVIGEEVYIKLFPTSIFEWAYTECDVKSIDNREINQ